MKIVFLLTSPQEARCGVCDYTQELIKALTADGVDCVMEAIPFWSFKELFQLKRKYKDKSTLFHLQYPSLNMGNSFAPAFLSFVFPNRVFATLHEFSVFHVLRKLVFLPYALLSQKVIFTNDYERKIFLEYFPLADRKTEIVPIGNNIAVTSARETPARPRLIYFGQIGTGKGIDLFLSTARELRARAAPVDIAVIGSIVSADDPAVRAVREAQEEGIVELLSDLNADDVSRQISRSTWVLLPFEDGITDKRGSALACLKHGVAVITRHSALTPDWLRQTTFGITSAEDAVGLIEQFINGQNTALSPDVAQRELALREWDAIAKRHMNLYGAGR